MISSNNLISMYLGIELQSLALYVLAAIKRDSIQSSESGVKYFILGALSCHCGVVVVPCNLGFNFVINACDAYRVDTYSPQGDTLHANGVHEHSTHLSLAASRDRRRYVACDQLNLVVFRIHVYRMDS